MIKLLLFFAIVFGVFYFFYSKLRSFLRDLFQPLNPDAQNARKQTAPPGAGEPNRINKGEMIQCAACDVYFPSGTGTRKNGKEFCSAACASKGPHE